MSDSLQSYGLWPARLHCPWDFSGKNTGVGCHFLLQRIFLTQGLNPWLLPDLLHYRQILNHWATWEAMLIPSSLIHPSLTTPSPWQPPSVLNVSLFLFHRYLCHIFNSTCKWYLWYVSFHSAVFSVFTFDSLSSINSSNSCLTCPLAHTAPFVDMIIWKLLSELCSSFKDG